MPKYAKKRRQTCLVHAVAVEALVVHGGDDLVHHNVRLKARLERYHVRESFEMVRKWRESMRKVICGGSLLTTQSLRGTCAFAGLGGTKKCAKEYHQTDQLKLKKVPASFTHHTAVHRKGCPFRASSLPAEFSSVATAAHRSKLVGPWPL